MNEQVSSYINQAPEDQKEIMMTIRKLIHDNISNVVEEFKWSRPIFKANKDFAYFKVSKAYVTFGFFDFHKLEDPKQLLEGTGKDMRHIKIKTIKDVDQKLLINWFFALTK